MSMKPNSAMEELLCLPLDEVSKKIDKKDKEVTLTEEPLAINLEMMDMTLDNFAVKLGFVRNKKEAGTAGAKRQNPLQAKKNIAMSNKTLQEYIEAHKRLGLARMQQGVVPLSLGQRIPMLPLAMPIPLQQRMFPAKNVSMQKTRGPLIAKPFLKKQRLTVPSRPVPRGYVVPSMPQLQQAQQRPFSPFDPRTMRMPSMQPMSVMNQLPVYPASPRFTQDGRMVKDGYTMYPEQREDHRHIDQRMIQERPYQRPVYSANGVQHTVVDYDGHREQPRYVERHERVDPRLQEMMRYPEQRYQETRYQETRFQERYQETRHQETRPYMERPAERMYQEPPATVRHYQSTPPVTPHAAAVPAPPPKETVSLPVAKKPVAQTATAFPTVKVSNIPIEYTRVDIMGAFKDHFDVHDVIMKTRGSALVMFKNANDARLAKEQFDGGEMNDAKIKVTWAESLVS